MIKRVLTCLLVISIITSFSPLHLLAFAADNTITLEVVQGNVKLKTSESSSWTDVTGKTEISEGSCINVPAGGSAVVHFPDGSIVRMYEKSLLGINMAQDLGGARHYNLNFVGKIVSFPVENSVKGSSFETNGPTLVISGNSKEYTAEVDPNLYTKVTGCENAANAVLGYNIEGTVKEILPENHVVIVEGKDGTVARVQVNPYTVVSQGYKTYKNSGNPDDLNDISKLSVGDKIVVFGEKAEKSIGLGMGNEDMKSPANGFGGTTIFINAGFLGSGGLLPSPLGMLYCGLNPVAINFTSIGGGGLGTAGMIALAGLGGALVVAVASSGSSSPRGPVASRTNP